jgi:hypothetical protein
VGQAETTEDDMRRIPLTLAAAAVILTAAQLAPNRAEAIPLGAPASIAPAVAGAPIENVALCYYVDGWNGPGLYQCGYRFRRGEGWYGRREERREFRREERRGERGEDRRDYRRY